MMLFSRKTKELRDLVPHSSLVYMHNCALFDYVNQVAQSNAGLTEGDPVIHCCSYAASQKGCCYHMFWDNCCKHLEVLNVCQWLTQDRPEQVKL